MGPLPGWHWHDVTYLFMSASRLGSKCSVNPGNEARTQLRRNKDTFRRAIFRDMIWKCVGNLFVYLQGESIKETGGTNDGVRTELGLF